MCGAMQVGQHLPRQYYEEITEKFLPAYKKEYAAGKSEGNIDESEADAISWDLFLLILHWLIEKEWNMFGWVFSILQWGHIACLINIGVLGLHNFSIGQDYIGVSMTSRMQTKLVKSVMKNTCMTTCSS